MKYLQLQSLTGNLKKIEIIFIFLVDFLAIRYYITLNSTQYCHYSPLYGVDSNYPLQQNLDVLDVVVFRILETINYPY